MSPPAVHQLLAAYHEGDAVGNEARIIRALLRGAGFASEIFAVRADPALRRDARTADRYDLRAGGAVCVYHFAAGSPASRVAAATADALVLMYHNVTPARFFAGLDDAMVRLCHQGRRELAALAGRAHLALAKSEYSRRELAALGGAPTGRLPYLVDATWGDGPAAPIVERLFRDGRTNVLVVGRIAPNKCVEDAILAFVGLKRLRPRSRLLIVGDGAGQATYLARLHELVRRLRLSDVVFAGRVDDDELRAYYRVADVLLSLSEHEGFGVPLAEAMLCDVPVVAYDAAAVAETLDGGGVLLRDKSPELVAALLARLVDDAPLRAAVLETQRATAARLRAADPAARLLEALAPVLAGTP